MTASVLLLVAGSLLLALGVSAQLRTAAVRRQWSERGMGLVEQATGLSSLAAVPIHWPIEQAVASELDHQLAVVVLRQLTGHPEQLGRSVAGSVRAHEHGWRIDYDVIAVSCVVPDDLAAVRAAARIAGDASIGEPSDDLRVGIARAPLDGSELLDLVDVALTRARSASVVRTLAPAAEA